MGMHGETLGTRIRIVLATYQLLATLGDAYGIPYPFAYQTALRYIAWAEFDVTAIFAFACFMPVNFLFGMTVSVLTIMGTGPIMQVISQVVKKLCSKGYTGDSMDLDNEGMVSKYE